MERKTSELDGTHLDLAFAMACGPHDKPPRIANGRCEVFDNPCGFPGPCYDWFPFAACAPAPDKPQYDISDVYLRYHLRWTGGSADALKALMLDYIAARLGSVLTLPDEA